MNDYVYVTVDEVLRTSDKAALCRFGDDEEWLPFSQLESGVELDEGDTGVSVGVNRWLAEQKGLEFEEA
jgi:hypothetical protein